MWKYWSQYRRPCIRPQHTQPLWFSTWSGNLFLQIYPCHYFPVAGFCFCYIFLHFCFCLLPPHFLPPCLDCLLFPKSLSFRLPLLSFHARPGFIPSTIINAFPGNRVITFASQFFHCQALAIITSSSGCLHFHRYSWVVVSPSLGGWLGISD